MRNIKKKWWSLLPGLNEGTSLDSFQMEAVKEKLTIKYLSVSLAIYTQSIWTVASRRGQATGIGAFSYPYTATRGPCRTYLRAQNSGPRPSLQSITYSHPPGGQL